MVVMSFEFFALWMEPLIETLKYLTIIFKQIFKEENEGNTFLTLNLQNEAFRREAC